MVHYFLCRHATQGASSCVRFEQIFLPKQRLPVPHPLHTSGPVVAQTHVDLGADLHQLPDVDLPDVVDTLDVILAER